MSARLAICLILAWPLSGCGAAPARPDLTPVAELPEHYRELWRAWLDEAPDWNERRAACLKEDAARTFLVENLAAVLLGSYARSELAAHTSARHGLFERARAELVILGEASVPTLMELHLIGDGATAFLTSEVLMSIGVPAIPACLASMDRPEEQSRRRAVNLLGQLPYGYDLEPEVRTALAACLAQDGDWLVRKTAAAAIARRGGRDSNLYPARNALARALHDSDEGVAGEAAMGLASLQDPRAVPDLIKFLQRAEQASAFRLYRVGQEALQLLTQTEDRRSVKGWGGWYRDWLAERKKTRDSGN